MDHTLCPWNKSVSLSYNLKTLTRKFSEEIGIKHVSYLFLTIEQLDLLEKTVLLNGGMEELKDNGKISASKVNPKNIEEIYQDQLLTNCILGKV